MTQPGRGHVLESFRYSVLPDVGSLKEITQVIKEWIGIVRVYRWPGVAPSSD